MPVPTDICGYLGWRTAYHLLELERGSQPLLASPLWCLCNGGRGRLPHWIPLGNREVADSVADAHTVAGVNLMPGRLLLTRSSIDELAAYRSGNSVP